MQNKEKRITWNKRALSDFDEITFYIFQKNGLIQADYVGSGIIKTIKEINPFPEKHPMLDYDPTIRYTIKWKFKIVFRIKPNKISILRIFYTTQDPAKLIIHEENR